MRLYYFWPGPKLINTLAISNTDQLWAWFESTQNPSSDSIWIEVCSGNFYATVVVRDKTVIEILT